MNRHYESLFLVPANTSEADLDTLLDRLKGIVTQHGGEFVKVEKRGVQKLAIEVKRNKDAAVVYWECKADPQVPAELERIYRLTPTVLRFSVSHKVKEPEPLPARPEPVSAAPPAASPVSAAPAPSTVVAVSATAVADKPAARPTTPPPAL